MITSLILLSIGIYLLILGSDFFVEGSTSIAKILKIPMIVIGLTIAIILFLILVLGGLGGLGLVLGN